jgi:hypothetical protein
VSVFQKSLPVLSTSFINKCGTIAISLLPMLLVERHVSTSSASLVMTAVKAALIGGILLGGWICDRFGLKPAVILSFSVAGIGLCFMAWGPSLATLCAFAVMGQLGQAMFRSPLRLMLTEMIPVELQQESIGWLRGANNLGQIVSYSIGSVFASLGIPLLILFDGITSLVAAIAGLKFLPRTRHSPVRPGVPFKVPWRLFVLCALILGGFMFMYELFMVGAAARCKLLFGASGLRLFATLMVVNTLLCSFFAVLASRLSRNPSIIFPFGILLVTAGACLFFNAGTNQKLLFFSMLLLTSGEILFTALAPFVLIRILPTVGIRGSLYSGALVIESLGQWLAAALAFPLVVHGNYPGITFLFAGAFVLILFLIARSGITEFLSRKPPNESTFDEVLAS